MVRVHLPEWAQGCERRREKGLGAIKEIAQPIDATTRQRKRTHASGYYQNAGSLTLSSFCGHEPCKSSANDDDIVKHNRGQGFKGGKPCVSPGP
jgi:hypothetical protein